MSAECPNGHGWKCHVVAITADGSPPVKNSDVIAYKLACGCVVGGADYEAFQAQVMAVRNAERLAITAAREEARKKLANAFKAFHLSEEAEP